MDVPYTPEQARSPEYWRGRAAACLDAISDRLLPSFVASLRAQAHFYAGIADGLERQMVDPEQLRQDGE